MLKNTQSNSFASDSLPSPRDGIAGSWDKFIGPGASLAENLVALLSAIFFAAFIAMQALYINAEWSPWQYLVACLLAFDMVGGIATTATSAAKRWYHRPGQTWRQHLKFIVPHTVHLALFSWLFVGDNRAFFAVFAAILLIGAVMILSVEVKIQRSVAHLLVFIAVLMGQEPFAIDPLMFWFIPALFIKLFASYLPSDGLLVERHIVKNSHQESSPLRSGS